MILASRCSKALKERVLKNHVLGMWRPETITATVGGKTTELFGPMPTGLLCFHESMHFVEVMSDPSVARFANAAREAETPAEDKAGVAGNLALFGTYTVDAQGNFTGTS